MAYIASPINQMTHADLTDEECVICFDQLYSYYGNGPVVEITSCHHRFHRDCLQTNCGNPQINDNSLINCACPICQQRFNFNIEIQDLSQQVTDRFALLEAQEADLAAGPLVVAGPGADPVAGLNPQLQNYLRSNYEMDRITKEFFNCFSQIIDDAVALRNDNNMGFDKANYGLQENVPIPQQYRLALFGDETKINQQKSLVVNGLILRLNNEILQRYKFNTAYSIELNNSLDILNTINQNIHDAAFVNSLYQAANDPLNENIGVLFDGLNGLDRKLSGAIYKLLASAINRQYQPSLHSVLNPFLLDLVGGIIIIFMMYNDTRHINRNFYYLNLMPTTITRINGRPAVRPDFQFFIRYFDCFVNFVRQLVAINFNVAQQLGGKRRKSRRVKKGRTIRKSRRFRK
jgi:hypothetical protein